MFVLSSISIRRSPWSLLPIKPVAVLWCRSGWSMRGRGCNIHEEWSVTTLCFRGGDLYEVYGMVSNTISEVILPVVFTMLLSHTLVGDGVVVELAGNI